MIHIKDELAFMRFLVAIAARSGQVLNYSNIADDSGVSQVTVKEWISAFVSASDWSQDETCIAKEPLRIFGA